MSEQIKVEKKQNGFLLGLKEFLGSGLGSITAALVIFIIFMCIATPKFYSQNNIITVLRQAAAIGIMSCAITPVVLCGKVDLSVGSILSLCALMSVKMVEPLGLAAALILPLLTAIGCGLINGAMVGIFDFHPFVATLATQSLFQAAAFFYSNGAFLETKDVAWFSRIGKGSVGIIPIPIIIFVVVFIIMYILLNKTVFGRRVYMVGANPVCSKYTGISSPVTIIITYVISAVATYISALILATRQLAAQPEMGVGYEFDCLAAIVVGGTALSGGKGNVVGTLFGVLFVTIVKNAFVLLEISLYYQKIFLGLMLLAAVIVQSLNERRSSHAK